jgi:hypothetical protein
MEYMHQGVKIELFPATAEFIATIKNESKSFGSLAAAKKAIDAARVAVFLTFKAYPDVRVEYANIKTAEGMTPISVVDLKTVKDRGRYSSPRKSFIDSGGNEHTRVLRATPEVIDIIRRAGEATHKSYLLKSAAEKEERETISLLRKELEQYAIAAGTFEAGV